MLTKLTIKGFKKFEEVVIELDNPVVFVGPNDSGKTSALQVLSLWQIGVRRWLTEKSRSAPTKRTGVSLDINELINLPVKESNLLWRNRRVRVGEKRNEKTRTKNILINVIVEGITNDKKWSCGVEFDYRDLRAIYCRPSGLDEKGDKRMEIPQEAGAVTVTYLPPMSGLASRERKLEPGAVNVLIGEGRTAEVLRNLCFDVLYPNGNTQEPNNERWRSLRSSIKDLFGIGIKPPVLDPIRGEIDMDYVDQNGVSLDLSVSGRGLQQVLLLLALMVSRPSSVILLDEPDAHLEILRQREVYSMLRNFALKNGSQIIIATHSEVVLNEAAGKDTVIAFVGKPHLMGERRSEVLKSLTTIGFEQYYQAELKKWVLYCEGPTDLAILREFAIIADHPASQYLERPFVYYVGNNSREVYKHFYGLRDAVPGLRGLALYDRLELEDLERPGLVEVVWARNEIENYFALPEVLYRFAGMTDGDDMFSETESEKRVGIMKKIVEERVPPIALGNKDNSFWVDTKITDYFLDEVFKEFYNELDIEPPEMRKGKYYRLARFMKKEEIREDIIKVLDLIYEIGSKVEVL